MTLTLKKLITGLDNLKIQGKDSVPVTALATDSRRVGPGTLFFALSGLRTDGYFFVAEAIDRGAVAVVCERDCWVPPHVTLILTADMRATVAAISARFYGHPEKGLELTGFVGTSGKTVASTLLRHFLGSAEPVGLIGTIHYAVGNRSLPAHRTTPEPAELYALLSQIREQGCRRALLEVSSHGIDQKRVAGLAFRNLVLLNLTPEHLQYHGSLDRYIQVERAFIEEQALHLNRFVAGIDDPEVRACVEGASAALARKTLTFGTRPEAVIRAEDVRFSERDTRFRLVWPEGSVKLVSPLVGEFNLQNVLAAIACGYAEGLDPVDMGAGLLSFNGVRGRMERLDCGTDFNVIIDYMHTVAAYEKGLDMLRGITEGRLITVFGCGGNRDAGVRPEITATVCRRSDIAIATADNPRNETVEAIFADMRQGNETVAHLKFIEDRRSAIATALEMAGPGDTVLIAGKGHETYQEFGDCVVPFDDRAVAREILQNRRWADQ